MAKQRADVYIARTLDAMSPRGVRLASGGIVAAAGLAGIAVPLVRLFGTTWTPSNLLLGVVMPMLFGLAVFGGGIWIAQSDYSGQLAVAIALWWFMGMSFGTFSGLGLVAFQKAAGVGVVNIAIIISGLGSIGGVGGLLVGRYDARSQRRRRALETERTRLADEREKLALLNRIVRHDIGNDLQIIGGMTSHLEGHVDEHGQTYLERVQRTTEEAIELTEQVRTFIASLSEDGTSERRRISLERILETQVDNAREVYRDASVAVDGSVPDISVYADELLSTVFHNLISNAIEHNDTDDPFVEVSVEREGDTVTVSVADNGPGIPPEHRDTIQAVQAGAGDHPNSGLGLYIVGMLVERYEGDVVIEDRESRGTIVSVSLPVADGE